MRKITLSIVSHGQASLIAPLLNDLYRLALADTEVIITLNIPEDERPFQEQHLSFRLIRNIVPKGFGENHNQAFVQSTGDYFIVVNPDIRIPLIDFEMLLTPMNDPKVAAISPIVLNSNGGVEDSARQFPTVLGLARRVLLGKRTSGYDFQNKPIEVDWAAGMFVLFRRESYQSVCGFDHQRFFMYMEDVDICRRLKENGWSIVIQPEVTVIHDAQRASHRSFKHLRWHLISAFRYFTGL